jgi:hypothetical protein
VLWTDAHSDPGNYLGDRTNDESCFAIPVIAGDVYVIENHLDPLAVFMSEHPLQRGYRTSDRWLFQGRL